MGGMCLQACLLGWGQRVALGAGDDGFIVAEEGMLCWQGNPQLGGCQLCTHAQTEIRCCQHLDHLLSQPRSRHDATGTVKHMTTWGTCKTAPEGPWIVPTQTHLLNDPPLSIS